MSMTDEDSPENRWTKKALLESEKRYRRLLDNSPDMIFRMSLPDRKFDYVSPAAEQITGYPPEDFYSHGGLLEKLLHPDWLEYFKNEWKALLKSRMPPFYEYQIVDRAGKTRWVRQTNLLVKDEGGHPVALEGIITDITGRRQAEAALQKSEEQYRNLVETTGTGYVILDKDGIVITANQEYIRLTGRADLAEIQGRPVTGWTAPYDLERNSREIEQCFKTGSVRGLEIDYLKPDGSIQHLEINASVIQSDAGKIIMTLCRDINERRRVEDALKDEQEFTRLLLDASPAYIVAIGTDGTTIMMNKALADALEYTPEDMRGADYLTTFVPEEERERLGRVFREIAYDGKITVNENRIVSKSGKSYLVEWHGRPVKQMAGKPDFFVGVGIDITSRRQIEEALRESEEKMSLVMDGVPALLAYVDADMRFDYVNKAYADWYGCAREDIIGKHVRDLLTGDVFEQSLPKYQEVLRGIPVWFENRTVDPVGKERFVSVSLIPDSRDDRVAGWFAAIMDITERKKAEQALQQSNRQLKLLSSITRHDIQNKIITILGYLSLAEMELNNPQVMDYLSNIESATRAIRYQIEFTKIYENLGTREPQWQDLGIIIALSAHIPPAIRLEADVQGVEVFADPMLERVFFTLLDNSVRHGEHVTRISVSAETSGDFLTIVWEDDGVGVPAEEKEKIFERGFGKNTGLGLFLSREILDITGITIIENGIPGKSARFEITVPKGIYR